MERRLGGQLNAVDTPPTGPPGVGEERQGQRVLDVVQRFLRRVPKPVRLPVVRPTVSEKEIGGELWAGGVLVWGLVCFLVSDLHPD